MSELAADDLGTAGGGSAGDGTTRTGTAGDAAVAAVRAFNRFYTNMIGLLRGKYLDTPYSLTEARILFELAQRDASEVTDLRRTVDIDAGYLSRILARFSSGRPRHSAALGGRRAPPGHLADRPRRFGGGGPGRRVGRADPGHAGRGARR